MNIKITHNWLLEYLDTDANPNEIQRYLSLCGPSVESVKKIDDSTKGGLTDYVYDIEIISNRIDTASVLGIAQEAVAILPMFGKKAKLRFDPLKKYRFSQTNNGSSLMNLEIKIVNANLCSRFTAIILDNIKIKPSLDFIQNRLTLAGIKSINNVVDISNYLMVTLGQPVHVFDYDMIGKKTMIMRESRKGEKIITLDKKEIALLGGDIVIEDGEGKLIDLCGIMGGLNSAVSTKTKKVILFVQTYNKEKIRKTVMKTGLRTVAATYFEKGLDEERVEATTVYGIELLKKYASGRIASKLYDIYSNSYKKKLLAISYSLFNKLIGTKIEKKIIDSILQNLGFKITHLEDDRLQVSIPSYRKYDISIPEDLVEEVARIYGYNKLPNNLPPPAYVVQPEEFEKLFTLISKIKYFLKHLGLNEIINYSMVSKKLLEEFNLNPEHHLRLANTISEEIEYMKTTLLPSLHKNIKDNTGKKEILKLFEIAKVYLPKKLDLPDEIYKLGITVNTDYFDLKGIIESLYKELNIESGQEEKIIGKDGAFMVEIDLLKLINNYRLTSTYKPINPYAVIKLDKTFELGPKYTYEVLKRAAEKSKLLQKIEVLSLYKNKLTLRFYYSSAERNITEEEAKGELEKIF